MGDARRHLTEGAELLGSHELILGRGDLAIRAGAVFEEPRAAERQRREVREVGQEPLVALGEGTLPAAERQHAQDAIARGHRHAEPVPEGGGARDGRDAVPRALGLVVVGPDRATGITHDRHEARLALRVAERGPQVDHTGLDPEEDLELAPLLVVQRDDHVANVEHARHLGVDRVDQRRALELARDRPR